MALCKKPRWAGSTAICITLESGNLVLGERTMFKQVWEGTYNSCRASIKARGYFGTSTDGFNMLGWVAASCEVISMRGAKGKLVITWEPGGANAFMPLPSDEISIESIELYPSIQRHPMFNQTSTGTGTEPDIDIYMLGMVEAAIHGASIEAKRAAVQQVENYPAKPEGNGQGELGVMLMRKLQKGNETYYMAGQKYTWTYYSYTLPMLTLGGFIQFPSGPGYAPDALDPTLSFLRLADTMASVGANGSMWKVTRTWLGGPGGHWDSDIYPAS